MAIPSIKVPPCGWAFIIGIALLCGGCGGGGFDGNGSNPAPAIPSRTLAWNPPSAFSDGTLLVPARDLDLYEIYVNDQGTFSPSDAPSAYVSAVDPATGQLETTFDLSNLRPFLSPGIRYYVAMRSVDKTGSKSDFSFPAPFSF